MKHITHLLSMTDFVLNLQPILPVQTDNYADSTTNYAKLLKTPLTLSMFVPATSEAVILKEPKKPHTYASENSEHYQRVYNLELYAYNQAKEKVLFEGFELCDRNTDGCIVCDDLHILAFERKNKTVEDMCKHELKLTPAALKMIYNN